MENTATGGNTTASGPASFAEAFAAETSPVSDSSTQTTTPSAAEQPTSANETTPTTGDDRSPFIPRARFDEVNTRLNELKQWREQHSWAEQVNRDTLAQMAQYFQLAQTNPSAYLSEYLAHLQQHNPQAIQALRSEFARQLAGGRQAQTAGDLDNLVIDLGNGQTIGLSDLKAQWLNDVRQELQPVTKTVEQMAHERAQLQALHDANQFGTTTAQELFQYPGMDDVANRKAVAEAIKAMQLTTDDPRDLRIAADRAWRQVVLPKLSSRAESQWLDHMKQKAAASTSVNPGSAAPSTSGQYRSFTDLPAEAWR